MVVGTQLILAAVILLLIPGMPQSRDHQPDDTKPATPSTRRTLRSHAIKVREKLGKVISDFAVIRNTPAQRARQLSKVSEGTYLVITGTNGDKYQVLLSDGSKGYIRKAEVMLVKYVVTKPKRSTK